MDDGIVGRNKSTTRETDVSVVVVAGKPRTNAKNNTLHAPISAFGTGYLKSSSTHGIVARIS
jgi:hypothetical protein